MYKIKYFLSPDTIKKIGSICFLIGLSIKQFNFGLLHSIAIPIEYIGIAILIYWRVKYSTGHKYIYTLYAIVAIAFLVYGLF